MSRHTYTHTQKDTYMMFVDELLYSKESPSPPPSVAVKLLMLNQKLGLEGIGGGSRGRGQSHLLPALNFISWLRPEGSFLPPWERIVYSRAFAWKKERS